LHQSNRLNPYIDWPFAPKVMPMLAEYVGDAAALGMHVKMYYTLGQMTNHMTELFALKSLGSEILLVNPDSTPPVSSHHDGVVVLGSGMLISGAVVNDTGAGAGAGAGAGGANGGSQHRWRARRGMGGGLVGNGWLEEHMVTGYEGGWFTMHGVNFSVAKLLLLEECYILGC
jgi:hypothetical protein